MPREVVGYQAIYISGAYFYACDKCSAFVWQPQKHDDWHKKNDKLPFGKIRFKNGS